MTESSELTRFYHSLIEEIKATQISTEDGDNLTQLFTQSAVDLMADAGETENVIVAYDEGQIGRAGQHQINAYSIADNYETLDLFITIFNGNEDPIQVHKKDVDTAGKRISNFLRKSIDKNYVEEIEESSPIFDFVNTLSESEDLQNNLVRINAIILTDGIYSGEIPETQTISEFPVYYRVIDIAYLLNINEKSHIPIEIDFRNEGFEIPCVPSVENEEYQSFLAIIPGVALATIYERFGSRLLEQNVRSFLQFTGKINKGIRDTIKDEPHMFLAFNNGLSATAEEVEVGVSEENGGFVITRVKDFQIVNGGQTTASIYHTFKKDKADISEIRVQIKLNVVKNKVKFSEIVSRISEYANTQNRISISDLSSNRPYHIQMEKLSRSLLAPLEKGQNIRTRWFYERARGQYRNARLKEGTSAAKRKAFDTSNPKQRVITKEELAKYINSFQEIYDGKKLVIGPHVVAKGNQKNYKSFIDFNLTERVNNIYFEDTVAKAILFRAAERIYGIKPNAIGDLRYLTVPYSVSLLGVTTNYQLSLVKIWSNQSISASLEKTLYTLMLMVESFIKKSAPGALYGEWAKKQECWESMKEEYRSLELPIEKDDLRKPNEKRIEIDDSDIERDYYKEIETNVKSITPEKWKAIYSFCKENEDITSGSLSLIQNVARKISTGIRPSSREIIKVNEILSTIVYKSPVFDSEDKET